MTETDHVTRILARVAHEMRSPLTVIQAAAELALNAPERAERNLQLVVEASHSLRTLLQDILDLSRLQEGGLELARQPFGLRDCLRHVLDGFALLAKDRKLQLDWWIEPSTPDRVYGDPGRLRQILSNLLANALKFTRRGGRVGVRVQPRDDYLQCEVTDTGIGIAPEAQARIFEPYSQASEEIGRTYGGNGLGLAIVRSLVELQGGEIGVESQPGQGSRFYFTVRLEPLDSLAENSAAVDLRDLQALVAAEDPSVLAELGPLLEKLGLRPVLCDQGPRALRLIETADQQGQPFALSILDLSLGGGDGLFVIGQIPPSLRASTRIVATTRTGTRGDGAACLELGVSAYLTLPLDEAEWAQALEMTLAAGPGELVTRHSLRAPV